MRLAGRDEGDLYFGLCQAVTGGRRRAQKPGTVLGAKAFQHEDVFQAQARRSAGRTRRQP